MPACSTFKASGETASRTAAVNTLLIRDDWKDEEARQAAPSPSLAPNFCKTSGQRRCRSAQCREYQHEGQSCPEQEKVGCRLFESISWVSASSICSQRRGSRHWTRSGAANNDRTRARCRFCGSDEDTFQYDPRYFAHSRYPTRFTPWKYFNKDEAKGAASLPEESWSLARGHFFAGEELSQSTARGQLAIPSKREIKRDEHTIQKQARTSTREVKVETQLDGGADTTPSEAWNQASGARSHVVNVADRVRAFESKATCPFSVTTTRKDGKTRADTTSTRDDTEQPVPLVFPLHVRRFTRRTGNGRFLRPQTPLYRSCPDDDTEIHAPLPQRTIPIVRSPIERNVAPAGTFPDDDLERELDRRSADGLAAPHSLSGDDATAKAADPAKTPLALPQYQVNPQEWPMQTPQAITTRVGPVSHLHGRRNSCFRHGRQMTTFKGTRDLYDQGGRGQYVAAGFDEPRNVDATSPYLVHNLTRYSRALDRDDACPDCVAELSIRRREPEAENPSCAEMPIASNLLQDHSTFEDNIEQKGTDSAGILRSLHNTNGPAVIPPLGQKSCQVEDDTDSTSLDALKESRMTAADEDRRGRSPNPSGYAATSDSNGDDRLEDEDKMVLTSDLGEGLDAVILERGGRLERVIMNLRKNTPTVAALLRLSRELIQVADALEVAASQGADSTDGAHSSPGEPTFFPAQTVRADLDNTPPRITDSTVTRQCNIPSTIADCDIAHCQAVPSQELFKPFPRRALTKAPLPSAGARIANRQSIEADYKALRKHFGRGSSYDEAEFAELGAEDRLQMRAARTFRTTPLGHNSDPRLLKMASVCSPRDVFSDDVASLGVPNISVTDNGNYEYDPIPLPSHILKARDMMYLPLSWRTTGTRSPPLFSQSTGVSPNASATSSTEHSPIRGIDSTVADRPRVHTWKELTDATAPSPDTARSGQTSSQDHRVYSEDQSLRHADRIGKNQAVHEAAALERQTRRRRYTKSQVRALDE
ncbi:hypothetical protein CB0940_00707 [Cercospora beticola]|uniref:Uncharacterized protein n=1 Tax=Cercospora beticola TaxID=122368 RepID=A0A2G5IC04_CERBT|nr:hypothetical protein CB0940_00707 [Cercospora beticola]PIB02242.1 hypothetical protein CB0940_00707 [Cercospora beticola]WPA96134.1 hypothetical protein RHO25_000740 [Cercospora beticola]CAK1355578.1 unnamed protein product [Cercospora beticola]